MLARGIFNTIGWLAGVNALWLWLPGRASSLAAWFRWLRLGASRYLASGLTHTDLLEVDVAVRRERTRSTRHILAPNGVVRLINIGLLDGHRICVVHHTRNRTKCLTLEWYLPPSHCGVSSR